MMDADRLTFSEPITDLCFRSCATLFMQYRETTAPQQPNPVGAIRRSLWHYCPPQATHSCSDLVPKGALSSALAGGTAPQAVTKAATNLATAEGKDEVVFLLAGYLCPRSDRSAPPEEPGPRQAQKFLGRCPGGGNELRRLPRWRGRDRRQRDGHIFAANALRGARPHGEWEVTQQPGEH